MRGCNDDFDFPRLYTALHNFCAVELSAFYFDVRKDALYCDRPDSPRRRAARTVLDQLFRCLTAWLAPGARVHGRGGVAARGAAMRRRSVHLELFPTLPADWRQTRRWAPRWERVREIRRVVTGALEVERREKRIGASLQAAPIVYLGAGGRRLPAGPRHGRAVRSPAASSCGPRPAPAEAFMLEDVAGVAVVPGAGRGR